MEDRICKSWQKEEDNVVDDCWRRLHSQGSPSEELIRLLAREFDSTFSDVLERLFARAYDANEWDLAKRLYASMTGSLTRYGLLAQVRSLGHTSRYQELLLILNPTAEDRLAAVCGDDIISLQIYLENVTLNQQQLLSLITELLEQRDEDATGITILKMLLPHLKNKRALRGQLTSQARRKQWRYAQTLLNHGVSILSSAVLQMLESSPWGSLRRPESWPDLPYRAVLSLQRLKRQLPPTLTACVGHDLAHYVQQAL